MFCKPQHFYTLPRTTRLALDVMSLYLREPWYWLLCLRQEKVLGWPWVWAYIFLISHFFKCLWHSSTHGILQEHGHKHVFTSQRLRSLCDIPSWHIELSRVKVKINLGKLWNNLSLVLVWKYKTFASCHIQLRKNMYATSFIISPSLSKNTHYSEDYILVSAMRVRQITSYLQNNLSFPFFASIRS